ncbi:tail fiber protein [uncultured Chitinophaga sp.]|jgi:Microcystin-dependent protein|uniref:phage tail protein n=1 Tax=uncultured Chitinophaga sp. TaxID=339340 RepID=UPI00261B6878|nr:tail fiber protein [uncultured Chitinophaga sp.]
MDPFLASLLLFGGNFAIRGYQMCWGQIISISQNSALFSLLGTTYGGNGQTTFALPDLRGRAPIGTGNAPGLGNYNLGQTAGTTSTTLTLNNMPAHNHVAASTIATSIAVNTTAATTNTPASDVGLAAPANVGTGPSAQPVKIYATPDATNTTTLGGVTTTGSVTIGMAGGTQPFSIQNPYLAMTWLIAMEGVYPSRN